MPAPLAVRAGAPPPPPPPLPPPTSVPPFFNHPGRVAPTPGGVRGGGAPPRARIPSPLAVAASAPRRSSPAPLAPAPAFTPAAQAALVDALARARTVPAVLHAVAPHRGARAFYALVLALARLGGLEGARAPGALLEPRFVALLGELHGGLSPESAVPVTERSDPRALASILHSLGRLRGALALGPPGEAESARRARLAALRPPGRDAAATAAAALAHAAAAAALRDLALFPPTPLAKTAEALAALGHVEPSLFRRVSALSASGVCAAAPACGRGGAFSPRDVAALARAYAGAAVLEDGPWAALHRECLRALPTFGTAALVSVCAALCASLSGARGAAKGGGGGGAEAQGAQAAAACALVQAQEKRLFALTEELSLRLSFAAVVGGGGGEDAALRGLQTVADPAQRLALMAARLGRAGESGGGGGSALLRTPERAAPVPLRPLAALLHAHAAAGSCPPVLFGLACELLAAPPPMGGSPAAGEGGDSDHGVVDVAMWGGVGGAGAPPPPSRLWTLDGGSLAGVAWALARSGFSGSASAAVWAQLAAAAEGAADAASTPPAGAAGSGDDGFANGAHTRTRAALEALATAVGARGSAVGGVTVGGAARPPAPRLRPGDRASLLWSLTTASVRAVALAARSLEHAAAAAPAYALPAIAQLLWAAAVQGVLEDAPGAARAAGVLEYVTTAAGAAAGAAVGDGGAPPAAGADPDAIAPWLLRDAEPSSASLRASARIAKAQLFEVLIALRCGGGGEGAAAATLALPAGAEAAWAAAYRRSTPPPAEHVGDVLRVLRVAGLPHEAEAHASCGLRLDALLPLPGASVALEAQGPASFSRAGGGKGSAPALTLAAAARVRWIAGAGLRPVLVTAGEWADNPSTDEKCALLAAKGLPIPQHLY